MVPAGPSSPAPSLHPNAAAVRDAGLVLGLDVEVVTYPEGTRTALDAATAIGCSVAQIVKSLIFSVDGELTLALVSGANQLDEAKLARAAGATETARANAEQVRDATGYPIGGVPPFGHRRHLAVFVDRELLDHDRVWAAAGTPHTVFATDPHTLVRVTGAPVVDLRRD